MDTINVIDACGAMVQAQNVLKLLKKACTTLKFDGVIEFEEPNRTDHCTVHFVPNNKCEETHYLYIQASDHLFRDLYSCLIVRVQEAGGIDKLPVVDHGRKIRVLRMPQ